MTEHWIVAETKPRAEHLAKFWLEAAGYGVYLPLMVSGDDTQAKPMLPRYLFVNVEPREGLWLQVRSIVGISRVLCLGPTPCRLPARDIETMRRREEAGVIRLKRKERLATLPPLKPGQPVRIHEGDFSGFDAIFDRMDGKERVRVFIAYLGRQTPVELARENVA